MAGPEIVDRSSLEVLLDNRRRDIRLSRHGRRISELLRDTLHDRRDRSLLLPFRLRKSLPVHTFRKVDRGEERAAPRPGVLGAEFLPELDLHVVVQPFAREVVEVVLPAVLEDPRATP
jgi:hypothetical protein